MSERERVVIGLRIFTAFAICGCIFMMYALVAFWREWLGIRKRRDARIVELRPKFRLAQERGKLLVMNSTGLVHVEKRSTAGRA